MKDLKGTEFTKKVVESINKLITLNEPLSHKDIDTSHFYGKKPTETKNVVIVRFIRRDLKNEVFFNKSQLKEFNKDNQIKVGITDHLTRYNKGLYDHAKQVLGHKNVWTSKCIIFAKIRGEKVKIRRESDIPCPTHLRYEPNGAPPPHMQEDPSAFVTDQVMYESAGGIDSVANTSSYVPPNTNNRPAWPTVTEAIMVNPPKKQNRHSSRY